MTEQEQPKNDFMHKLALQIVERRNLVFLIVILGTIFTIFSRSWVKVESDLTTYLPKTSETRMGLDIMEKEFTTYGSADVMVANITPDEADQLNDELAGLRGIQMIEYDDTTAHYNNVSALYSITFDYPEDDDQCLETLESVKEYLKDYDIYVSTSLGNTQEETIEREVNVIMVYVAIIIVVVLIFTSQTYAEVPVLLLTFVVGMILNMGTNFLLGTISFVSNSVTNILQLALSLDYAIIFCNHFKEEHETLPLKEAVIESLAKSIPEISSSSLTTIGGLVAMLFMQFRLGPDMALCLIKSILFALLSAFVVMPGLLMLFGPLIDRTPHRSFVPKIPFVGNFDYATRHVVPIIFALLITAGFFLSARCPYAYGYSLLTTPKQNESQIAQQMIDDTFTSSNMLALMVPAGDYDSERALLAELEQYDEVDHTMGLVNIEALDGYMLADELTPRQFAELAGLDYETAQLVYAAYAAMDGDYGQLVGKLSTYKVPLLDMFLFVCEQVDAGVVTLSADQTAMLQSAQTQMRSAKNQLQSDSFSRMLVYLTLPESGDETYAFTDKILDIAQEYYPGQKVYLAGDSTNEYDFEKSFAIDNKVVSVVSILVVMVVLLFTFNSAGMPVLLILVIQGCIWINFSVPAVTGKYLFYLSYLIVSSIQMGANIDYAIVIASRYQELKVKMAQRNAIVETLNFAFPTIITSGAIMSICGFLIGSMTSEPTIAGIGESLGRGTVISILVVMFALPQILLIGSRVIDKTSFSVPSVVAKKAGHGSMTVNGLVYGHINGTIRGVMRATVEGDIDLTMLSGTEGEEADDRNEET